MVIIILCSFLSLCCIFVTSTFVVIGIYGVFVKLINGVFDLKKNTYYRFEPHGWARLSSDKLDDIINWEVIWSFENAHLIEKAENSPNSFKFNFFGKEPEYIKPKDILPEIGPQRWESYATKKEKKSEIGKCQIWNLAYMHHVVHYPDKSPKEICFMLGYKSDMARRYILKYMTKGIWNNSS